MSSMQISVIIPTYNRMEDLDKCLASIIAQTKLPKEALVIDNGTGIDTKNLIRKRRKDFSKKGITLRYIKNERENSLTIAKNIGLKCSAGQIISFLDDDLLLDKNYYEEILRVYYERPNALGVQGFNIVKEIKGNLPKFINRLIELFNKLFYLGLDDRSKCRVLPSLGVTYPFRSPPDEVISCEWLSGASTYKKHILEEIKPDENLLKYANNEDQDLSYRIFNRYPGSLFMTPYGKYWHKKSPEGRIPSKELLYMAEVYDLYLFYKNIDQNQKNKLIYMWSRVGRIILEIAFSIRRSKSKLTQIKYTLGAPIYCMKHLEEIKKGDLEFFNKTLRK